MLYTIVDLLSTHCAMLLRMSRSAYAAVIAALLSSYGFAQAPQFTISTVAGNGTPGFSGDGGAATNAALNLPYGVAVDSSGNLYIGDGGNHRVRKVTPGGTITTAAGTGAPGFAGDGGPATQALFNDPLTSLPLTRPEISTLRMTEATASASFRKRNHHDRGW